MSAPFPRIFSYTFSNFENAFFLFFSTIRSRLCSPLGRDNSGIDLFSHLMAGLTVVDELQAYLLRIKHELDPCVEHIAHINTNINIQTIEHSCGHSLAVDEHSHVFHSFPIFCDDKE